jgi:hypothetical protein
MQLNQRKKELMNIVNDQLIEACDFIMPIVSENDNNKFVSNFGMMQILREHFPFLEISQANVIVKTAENLHRLKKFNRIGNIKN